MVRSAPAEHATLYRRHFVIPDTQIKPGEPTDHIGWIAQAVLDYKPDVVVVLGDWWDFPSLNRHVEPGSAELEGARIAADIEVGNTAFEQLSRTVTGTKGYKPECHFLLGNHEDRADRAAATEPKLKGIVGSHLCKTPGFKRHKLLERFWKDGLLYSHFFQSPHSDRPIGGSIDSRLNKVGTSFVQGHVQGFLYGNRIMASGKTQHGLVCGSAYLHQESYRGAQGQRHWQGVVVLNEVKDGDYCVMPLTLSYLCRRYTGKNLVPYMRKKYPHGDWSHL